MSKDENGESKKKDRTETAVVKVHGVDPSYLSKYVEGDKSLDTLKAHRTVPRLKIVQAPSDQELKDNFGEGAVIIRPGDAMICKYKDDPSSFEFVPVFFFPEWAKWADLRAKGQMIIERSFDPTSETARRAKNFDMMREPYPGQEGIPDNDKNKMYYRYVEHLRFIGVIYGDHPLTGTVTTLSFERGEWKQGKNFISAVMLRRQEVNGMSTQVPLWAQVWTLQPVHRSPDASRKWYGFKFEPADPPIIASEEAEIMRTMHEEFKKLFEEQRLMVQDEAQESVIDEAAVRANETF